MTQPTETDVFIMGAGPAGLCAALRLQQLNYRVTLIERSAVWPRPQIGEALTPGVKNIIDFLDANDALEMVPHRAGLPTRLCWRSQTPETVFHGDSATVDRAALDAALLQLAIQRGIQIHQPAQLIEAQGKAGEWQVCFSTPHKTKHTNATTHQITARVILDAQGRHHQTNQQNRLSLPRLSAMWAELSEENTPHHLTQATQVEALEQGWLWGTQLPDRRYRIMLLSDPSTSRLSNASKPEAWLRTNCEQSHLFSSLANNTFASDLHMCSATPYIALDSWQEGRIKLGDAAFALDPISSSGVEKAMRFSLQTAIAIHTYFQDDNTENKELARDFYQQRLIETSARHQFWTASYYQQAWCNQHPFWQERATHPPTQYKSNAPAVQALHKALESEVKRLADYQEQKPRTNTPITLHHMIRLNPQIQITPMLCVIGDQVERRPAIVHPHLEHPLAFWENEALLPRLEMLFQKMALFAVLRVLNQSMTTQKAQRLITWLWQHGLVDVDGANPLS